MDTFPAVGSGVLVPTAGAAHRRRDHFRPGKAGDGFPHHQIYLLSSSRIVHFCGIYPHGVGGILFPLPADQLALDWGGSWDLVFPEISRPGETRRSNGIPPEPGAPANSPNAIASSFFVK